MYHRKNRYSSFSWCHFDDNQFFKTAAVVIFFFLMFSFFFSIDINLMLGEAVCQNVNVLFAVFAVLFRASP